MFPQLPTFLLEKKIPPGCLKYWQCQQYQGNIEAILRSNADPLPIQFWQLGTSSTVLLLKRIFGLFYSFILFCCALAMKYIALQLWFIIVPTLKWGLEWSTVDRRWGTYACAFVFVLVCLRFCICACVFVLVYLYLFTCVTFVRPRVEHGV